MDRCEDLMGKYELVLRRTTQVEMSMGIMRNRFETYPPQQFDLTDVLDTPITLGNHVVAVLCTVFPWAKSFEPE